MLIECFTGLSVDSEKLQVTEDTLSSLYLSSSDCQVETVGSPKKKQKHDDTGIIKFF